MAWLSKDFESERKWKLTQAKKVAIRASKGMLDQAARVEKQEEEQRLRKVALNISKDIKKFWLKIEKLVLYKHQLELDEKKKKALDKQLEFLLGQTERYSTMLAENLVSSPSTCKRTNSLPAPEAFRIQCIEGSEGDVTNCDCVEEDLQPLSTGSNIDDDFGMRSEEEMENVRLVVDIASEIPDHEPLVQKHFFALLSSVWKVQKSLTNTFSSSQNGFFHSGSLFTPIMSPVSTNYSMGPPVKRFSNSSVCTKLVAVALSDQQSAQNDERVPICDQREEASFPAEHLDITLEFGAEKDDKTIPLLYPVTVKILSPGSPSFPRMTIAEHHHFKSSQIMAENRFWAASSSEGCLDWASLAFPIGDAKSRTPLKSQFLGKHKPSDSVKVSKSKSRKISTESSDVGQTKDIVLLPMPSVSDDSCSTADVGLSFLTESGNGFEDRTLFDLNPVFNAGSEDVLEHEYVPEFISGLDDWSVFPEFTNIG